MAKKVVKKTAVAEKVEEAPNAEVKTGPTKKDGPKSQTDDIKKTKNKLSKAIGKNGHNGHDSNDTEKTDSKAEQTNGTKEEEAVEKEEKGSAKKGRPAKADAVAKRKAKAGNEEEPLPKRSLRTRGQVTQEKVGTSEAKVENDSADSDMEIEEEAKTKTSKTKSSSVPKRGKQAAAKSGAKNKTNETVKDEEVVNEKEVEAKSGDINKTSKGDKNGSAKSGGKRKATKVVVEHCTSWRVFGRKAKEIECHVSQFLSLPFVMNPVKPRRQAFEISIVDENGDEQPIWSGLKKGPPRAFKFPAAELILGEIKKNFH